MSNIVYPPELPGPSSWSYDSKDGFVTDISPSKTYIAVYYELNKKEVWEKKTHTFTYPIDERDINNAEWAGSHFSTNIYHTLVPHRGNRLYGSPYLRVLSIETYKKEVK